MFIDEATIEVKAGDHRDASILRGLEHNLEMAEKQRENPVITDRLFHRHEDGTEVPVEEWRQVYRQFENFSYSSADQRLSDLVTVANEGMFLLHKKGLWDECTQLADELLHAFEGKDTSKYMNSVYITLGHWFKALCLIGRGELSKGFRYYINQMHMADERILRRELLGMGIFIVRGLSPYSWEPEQVPYSDNTEVPAEIQDFVHQIAALGYPDRKLPVPLRGYQQEKLVTWSLLYSTLVKFRHPKLGRKDIVENLKSQVN